MHWWQNREFTLEQITNTDSSKSQLDISPDGKKLAFAENNIDLMIADTDGKNAHLLFHAVDRPFYNWSPDSKWLVGTFKDSYDNYDVWIVSTEGTRDPYNLSRHPNYDADAVWSPDGKKIAFIGERGRYRDIDINYVYLRKEDHEASKRDHSIDKALDAMKDVPLSKVSDNDASSGTPKDSRKSAGVADSDNFDIDFDGLFERVERITIANSKESNLFWSHDGKALAFRAKIAGKDGTYKIFFPNSFKPEFMTNYSGYYPKWIKDGGKILWMVGGVPALYTKKLPVKCYQETNLEEYRRLAFRMIWRKLKDSFYDERFNNNDWDALRLKYEDAAARAPDVAVFSRVVGMLEGELNASHTGFVTKDGKFWKTYSTGEGWNIRTANIGLHFDPMYRGPGLKVSHVLAEGPADQAKSNVQVGEILLAIDGVNVHPGFDLTQVLNGPYERDIYLQVKNAEGQQREVVVRPISYDTARELVSEEWIDRNRQQVEDASEGSFAYLHVDQMMWPEFERFEQEIFALGYNKDGFVIDVRNNRGGVTADHLLMILSRNLHAYTIPRGGEVSYPRGYLAFTSWDKPIVVLCNQYTGSNGEIFSHAIKTLKRGKLVGVPSQGGVISMPKRSVLDFGTLSIPRRGWFVADTGEDMEMNGARPDYVMWPHQGDIPVAKDVQLEKAIAVLMEDVTAFKAEQRPPLIRASERTK
jgi:tricorn protease